MINHARTLLLNISGSQTPTPDYPGEEYVPAGFKAQTLPVKLSNIRNILMGTTAPDRALLNYRLRQFACLVHSNELEKYVLGLDPRVTYWPLSKVDLFNDSNFGPTTRLLAGTAASTITILGQPESATSTWRLLDSWKVTVTNSTTANVKHLQSPYESVDTGYTITGGTSQLIALPGSNLSFSFSVGTGGLPAWEVDLLLRPLLDLPDIYLMLQNSLNVDDLFLGSEPYTTFRTLWTTPTAPIAHKLGAVILALAYRLDAIFRQA